jgi:hypothetical protein
MTVGGLRWFLTRGRVRREADEQCEEVQIGEESRCAPERNHVASVDGVSARGCAPGFLGVSPSVKLAERAFAGKAVLVAANHTRSSAAMLA